MRILITGGTGYIGARLADRLAKRGEKVRVFGLPIPGMSAFGNSGIDVVVGDILDPLCVERAMRGCDRVFHLAAYARNWAKDPQTFFQVNVGGTKIVLEAALRNGVRRFIHTSSNVTLGPSNGSPVDENTNRTTGFLTDYEHSKFLGEKLALCYAKKGLDVVVVHPGRVFGPGPLSESNSVTKMIQWYLQGKWRLILGDGNALGNYVYVDDLIEGFILAMEKGKSGENYILGGENVSFNRFFDTLSRVANKRHRIFHLPASVALVYSKLEKFLADKFSHYPLITPAWVRTYLIDWANSCKKAERELGYTITPFPMALEKTKAWLEEYSRSENSQGVRQ